MSSLSRIYFFTWKKMSSLTSVINYITSFTKVTISEAALCKVSASRVAWKDLSRKLRRLCPRLGPCCLRTGTIRLLACICCLLSSFFPLSKLLLLTEFVWLRRFWTEILRQSREGWGFERSWAERRNLQVCSQQYMFHWVWQFNISLPLILYPFFLVVVFLLRLSFVWDLCCHLYVVRATFFECGVFLFDLLCLGFSIVV